MLCFSVTLLDQVIQQARHMMVRRRTMEVLDDIARQVRDPLLAAHWSSMNSTSEAVIQVSITSSGYETAR